MKFKNPHFIFEASKQESAGFAAQLIAAFGQAAPENADIIISVGGDGLLLQALRQANGIPVYGITPPGSNSRGFWTDHDVDSPQKLDNKLSSAETIFLAPLCADIAFANGKHMLQYAFNDVAIERASGQSALIHLTAQFQSAVAGPYRIMGDGFVFSTALGSTGTNRAYNGPVIDIHNNVMILTGKGIYEPRGMTPMVATADHSVFHLTFGSVAHKRPVRIDYDGHSVQQDNGSPIESLTVFVAHDKAAKLLVTSEPGIRAFSGMMPQGPSV